MGIIKVRGSAKKDFEADMFRIRINIIAKSKLFGEALFTGRNRTEHFLGIMESNLGLKPEDFTAGDFSVTQSYSGNGTYSFEKMLTVSVKADLSLVEKISSLLEEMSDMSYTVEVDLSDEKEKEAEVLRSAVEDSRKRADAIAASLGQKVIGAEESSFEFHDGVNVRERGIANSVYSDDIGNKSSKIKKPVKTIQQSIIISWLTE